MQVKMKDNFLAPDELALLNFKSLGENVKISRDARLYKTEQISIGNNSRIDDFSILSGNIKIGNNVHVASHCVISGKKQIIELCDFSGLAFGCKIIGCTDDYSGLSLTNPTIPSKFKNEQDLGVRLGKHVIIGTASIILPGAKIGNHSAVGAMSLVTKDISESSFFFGIPAKRIKSRKDDLKELERKFLSNEYE
jgi:galactoside O-acetyltransferase